MSEISDTSDEDLISQYLDGEQIALKALIDRYTPLLYNFVARFVGQSNAPDVVQDVFIKVWKNIKKFDVSKSHFKTWVFTIARNTTTDYMRKKKLILFSDMDNEEEENFADSVVDTSILPDEAIERIEENNLLDKLLTELPDQYRAVLVLYYQEDMTFAEIGKVLDKPLNTVKSQHRRALERLRKMVI